MEDGIKARYIGPDVDDLVDRLHWSENNFKEENHGEISRKTLLRNAITVEAFLKHETRRMLGDSYALRIRGSLHKYFTNGDRNHDRFSIADIPTAIEDLCAELGIDAEHLHIENNEIGVNLFHHEMDILDNVISYKGQMFNSEYNGGMRTTKSGNNYLKFFGKGSLCGLPYERLRLELKQMRNAELRRHGISTLEDLKDKDKLDSLAFDLIEMWSHVILDEPSIRMDES
jgi:hypothetical protein